MARYYKDTALNRKLGRVGKEITKDSAAKKQPIKKSDTDPKYDKSGRKDRSRVKSSKYVDSEDDDSNTHVMPSGDIHTGKKHTKSSKLVKKAPKKAPKKASKKGNTEQYQRLLDRTKARKAKAKATPKTVLPKGRPDSDKKYNDEYSKQLINKKKLNEELNEKGKGYRKARKDFGKDDPKRPPPKPPRGVPRKKKKAEPAPDFFAGMKDSDFDEFFEKPKKKKETLDEMIDRKYDEHKAGKKPTKPTKPKPKKARQKKVKVPPKPKEEPKDEKQIQKKNKLQEVVRRTGGKIRSDKKEKAELGRKVLTKLRKGKKKQNAERDRKMEESYKDLFSSDEEEGHTPISVVGKKDIPTRFVSYAELQGNMGRKYKSSGRLFHPTNLGTYLPETEFNMTAIGNNLDDRLIAVQEAIADMDRQGVADALEKQKLDEFESKGYSPGAFAQIYGSGNTAPLNVNPDKATEEQKRITRNYVPRGFPYPPTERDIKQANTPAPLEEIGGSIKKAPKPSGGPAPNNADGFRNTLKRVGILGLDGKHTFVKRGKTNDIGIQDIEERQDLEDKSQLYADAGQRPNSPTGRSFGVDYLGRKAAVPPPIVYAGTGKTKKQIEKEIEKKEDFVSKRPLSKSVYRAVAQDTSWRAKRWNWGGFIKNTRATYTKTVGKKPLYKDRKEALLQGLLAGGNERTLPVRNPRYFKGNKKGDAEFIRQGEQITQVKDGVKTKTRDRGDGIVPKKDAKIPPKPRQPKTNKSFLDGRKLKDLSAADKKEYEKVKKANQRYNKKLLDWNTKYSNIPAPKLKVPPSSASLTKGNPRVIDKYEIKGKSVISGGEGYSSITKKSTYQKGVVKDAMNKLKIPSKVPKKQTATKAIPSLLTKKGRTASADTKEQIKAKKAKVLAGLNRRTERLKDITALSNDPDTLLTNAQLKERRGNKELLKGKKKTTTKVQDRILSKAGRIGKDQGKTITSVASITGDEERVQIANMIQEAQEAKGKNKRQYQKIRQTDTDFQQREGQQRAVEILARKGDKRQIGVKSKQDVESRQAKIEKDTYKPSNIGKGKASAGVDSRYFNLAQDWQSGETFHQDIREGDNQGDVSYGVGWSG